MRRSQVLHFSNPDGPDYSRVDCPDNLEDPVTFPPVSMQLRGCATRQLLERVQIYAHLNGPDAGGGRNPRCCYA